MSLEVQGVAHVRLDELAALKRMFYERDASAERREAAYCCPRYLTFVIYE